MQPIRRLTKAWISTVSTPWRRGTDRHGRIASTVARSSASTMNSAADRRLAVVGRPAVPADQDMDTLRGRMVEVGLVRAIEFGASASHLSCRWHGSRNSIAMARQEGTASAVYRLRPRKPMTSAAGCCARAAGGYANAAPPKA